MRSAGLFLKLKNSKLAILIRQLRLAVEMMQSLAPSTAALNQPIRSTGGSPDAGEDDS
jgi:hypothetical protein